LKGVRRSGSALRPTRPGSRVGGFPDGGLPRATRHGGLDGG
jgi:hypothetical protein